MHVIMSHFVIQKGTQIDLLIPFRDTNDITSRNSCAETTHRSTQSGTNRPCKKFLILDQVSPPCPRRSLIIPTPMQRQIVSLMNHGVGSLPRAKNGLGWSFLHTTKETTHTQAHTWHPTPRACFYALPSAHQHRRLRVDLFST